MTGPETTPLAEALAALTCDGDAKLTPFWEDALLPYRPCDRIRKSLSLTATGAAVFSVVDGPEMTALPAVVEQPWAHATTAEALRALVARGLAPPSSGWWCGACDGTGRDPSGGMMVSNCMACLPAGATYERGPRSTGLTPSPPDHATLVAVAALGPARWLRAEGLARGVEPGAAVGWRALTREGAQEWHQHAGVRHRGMTPARVFSLEALDARWEGRLDRERWPEECPYKHWLGAGRGEDPFRTRRGWPALRALAAEGVHLTASRAGRVDLAVEIPLSTSPR